jgi:hypothetical protein
MDALNAALSVLPKWDTLEAAPQESSIYIVLVARPVARLMADCARIKGHRLYIVQEGIALRANGRRGRGTCVFPKDIDSSAFEEAVRTITLFLVAHAGRTPVHASAIMIGHRAIVMAGNSGSGKSSLALAANRAGLSVLSEDALFVQLEPSFRVWALCEAIHVVTEDAPPGPTGGNIRIRAGRRKRAIPIRRRRQYADRAILCVIARGKQVGLERIDREEAVRLLTQAPEPGFNYYGARAELAIRALATEGCWRLTLSRDLDAALAELVFTFSEVSTREQTAEGGF